MFKFDFDIDEAEKPIFDSANPPNAFASELENVTSLQAFEELPLNQLVRSKSASATLSFLITK